MNTEMHQALINASVHLPVPEHLSDQYIDLNQVMSIINSHQYGLEVHYNTILYKRIKDSIGFTKSQMYKDWIHKENPDCVQHHPFGSYGSAKTTDYVSVPITPLDHAIAHDNQINWAIDNLPLIISTMIKYIKHLEGKVNGH